MRVRSLSCRCQLQVAEKSFRILPQQGQIALLFFLAFEDKDGEGLGLGPAIDIQQDPDSGSRAMTLADEEHATGDENLLSGGVVQK